MISWIIATNDPAVLEANIRRTVYDSAQAYGDTVTVIHDAPSITDAYSRGQNLASHSIKCYIHHDVKILDLELLRSEIIEGVERGGMVGVVGSKSMVLPWWNGGPLLGSVCDRGRLIDFGPGGECAVVDGLLLATKHHIPWDPYWPGWHGYEYDACTRFIQRGIPNWCISGGHKMVSHNSDSPYGLDQIDGWYDATQEYYARWGDISRLPSW